MTKAKAPKPRRFAETTSVPVERTRAQLDALLAKHGASERATYVDDKTGLAAVQCRLQERMIRFEVRVPQDIEVPHRRRGKSREQWRRERLAQLERQSWRRLLLLVTAKLEAIADGITTVEREFLADILLPDGRPVHLLVADSLEESYRTGKTPRLLLPGMVG